MVAHTTRFIPRSRSASRHSLQWVLAASLAVSTLAVSQSGLAWTQPAPKTVYGAITQSTTMETSKTSNTSGTPKASVETTATTTTRTPSAPYQRFAQRDNGWGPSRFRHTILPNVQGQTTANAAIIHETSDGILGFAIADPQTPQELQPPASITSEVEATSSIAIPTPEAMTEPPIQTNTPANKPPTQAQPAVQGNSQTPSHINTNVNASANATIPSSGDVPVPEANLNSELNQGPTIRTISTPASTRTQGPQIREILPYYRGDATPSLNPAVSHAVAPGATPYVVLGQHIQLAHADNDTPDTETHTAPTPVEQAEISKVGNPFNMTRGMSVPIEGISGAEEIPQAFTTADTIIPLLDKHIDEPALKMEILRRGYESLGEESRKLLIQRLEDRYQAERNNSRKFFDYGYALYMYDRNKTGLFFLRKAHDYISDPFVSMAYAMAQAEADFTHEDGTLEDLNTRKLDVTYKLNDALIRNQAEPQKNFWPAFIDIIERLEKIPAYRDYTSGDFSRSFVAYGPTPPLKIQKPQYIQQMSNGEIPAEIQATHGAAGDHSNEPYFNPQQYNWNLFYTSRQIPAGPDSDQVHTVYIFNPNKAAGETNFHIVIVDEYHHVISEISSPVAPYIFEDLDRDGQYEVVLRQYKYNRRNPIVVYRYMDGAYVVEPSIQQLFQ